MDNELEDCQVCEPPDVAHSDDEAEIEMPKRPRSSWADVVRHTRPAQYFDAKIGKKVDKIIPGNQ